MNEDQYQKATNLRQRIALMKAFLYAIDRNTVGTLGHTGFMRRSLAKRGSGLEKPEPLI